MAFPWECFSCGFSVQQEGGLDDPRDCCHLYNSAPLSSSYNCRAGKDAMDHQGHPVLRRHSEEPNPQPLALQPDA